MGLCQNALGNRHSEEADDTDRYSEASRALDASWKSAGMDDDI